MASHTGSSRARRARCVVALTLAAGLAVPVVPAQAQERGPQARQPAPQAWVGEMGITETVAQIMARHPGFPTGVTLLEADERDDPDRSQLRNDPASPAVPRWPYRRLENPQQGAPTYPLVSPPNNPGADNPQTITTNFEGTNVSQSGFIPPDSQFAVGLGQILAVSNGVIRLYDKSGNLNGALNTTLNNFFTTVRNGSNPSDPQVRFDRLSNKWYVLCINVSTPNRFLLAVSSGPVITNTSSFTFFFFQQDTVAPAGDSGRLADYPSLGIDANALVTGANMFPTGQNFSNTSGWCIQDRKR